MDAPKRATKAVLGMGGAVGLGTVVLLISWKVEPVEARVKAIERSSAAMYAELIRRSERIEDKQDRLFELIRGKK